MRRFGAALAISVLLVTSACGGGGSRPSQDEVSQALQKGGDNSILGDSGSKVSKKAADCVAKVLVDSRISDRALQAIVDGKRNYSPSKADQTAAVGVANKIVKCLPAGLK
ncbi:hypothetical protein [Nocardioides marmorisolisilvae]|uniref:DUF732 domain-containing protein n=1 Tax=Nocardioides marmorisolisilvae TaxID=1542737 RepID=A0A3N0DVC0_9ACTN|nr:hypothetical protein [Nocardioides marmorisolisilvae]RNL79501.1 hypothetical protein EFL95_10995 [Nocardioides marmorisolisilvae]